MRKIAATFPSLCLVPFTFLLSPIAPCVPPLYHSPMAKQPPKPAPTPSSQPFQKTHEALITRIQSHLGPTVQILRELIPTGPRIDIHLAGPTDQLPFYKLFTVGMSQTVMPAPEELKDCARAELILGLPEGWPVNPEALMDDAHRWPVLLLRHIARIPALAPKGQWLFSGSLMSAPTPLATDPQIKFTGAVLLPPLLLPEDDDVVFNADLDPVFLLGVFPLYSEELAHAQIDNAADLLEAFDELEVTEILDVNRPNTCEGY
jgi:hypothetical protein